MKVKWEPEEEAVSEESLHVFKHEAFYIYRSPDAC